MIWAMVAYCAIGALYLARLWRLYPPESGDQVRVSGLLLALIVWPILAALVELRLWLPPYGEGGRD